MSSACFLHLFIESSAPRESASNIDLDSILENPKIGNEISEAELGTETFTFAKTEERDQDHHLSQLYAIPRPV
jgi:hypothetical protein